MHPTDRPTDGVVRDEDVGSARADLDSWTRGHARLVVFKAERLLTEAQRELGAFGADTLSADLAPELLRASEHVGEAIAVIERLSAELQGR